MQNKRGEIDWKKLIIVILIILVILALGLIINKFYNEQRIIGEQECERIGFDYYETKLENKEFNIYCYTTQNKEIKLIKIDNEWERIS